MNTLKENLKSHNFMKCYLFYGSEQFLKNYYEKRLKNAILISNQEMNFDIFEGRDIDINNIIDSADTLPFMSDKRFVIVKDSELFFNNRKNDTERMKQYLKDMPQNTCILFIENEIDKRNKLYKAVNTIGHCIEFVSPKENELVAWLQKEFKNNNKIIETKTAIYMLRNIGTDMEFLINEIQKLVAYKYNQSDITKEDIDLICTKSLEARIFDMLNAMGNKNMQKALEIYNNMITLKEAPIKILIMIIRQFRLLIQVKYLLIQGYKPKEIADRLKQKLFLVNGLIQQCENFSYQSLMQAFEQCLETDLAIKTGTSPSAIELLIVKLSFV